MKQQTIKTIVVEFTEEEFKLLTSLLNKVSADRVGEDTYNLLMDLYQGKSTN